MEPLPANGMEMTIQKTGTCRVKRIVNNHVANIKQIGERMAWKI